MQDIEVTILSTETSVLNSLNSFIIQHAAIGSAIAWLMVLGAVWGLLVIFRLLRRLWQRSPAAVILLGICAFVEGPKVPELILVPTGLILATGFGLDGGYRIARTILSSVVRQFA